MKILERIIIYASGGENCPSSSPLQIGLIRSMSGKDQEEVETYIKRLLMLNKGSPDWFKQNPRDVFPGLDQEIQPYEPLTAWTTNAFFGSINE
jgi:hypothetical protein